MKKMFNKINVILKKIAICISFIFVLGVIAISFTACKKTGDNTDKIKIVTTIFPAYDFSKQIGMEKVNVELLVSPGAEIHSYEPSPQDIIKISESDIFIYIGGENDNWVDGILETIDSSSMKIIKLMDCVEVVEEEIVDGMEEDDLHNENDEDKDDDHKEWDEHVWTSPINANKICKKIEAVLSEVDSNNSEFYKKNYSEYANKLTELDNAFREVIDNGKRKELIFGDRFPVRYFTEEYGLTYYAAFPGCSSSTEASASTISFLIDKVKKDNIPVVLKIELSTGNIAKAISDETGAKIYTFYACHNLTKEDFNEGKTYLDYMWVNLETLKIALN